MGIVNIIGSFGSFLFIFFISLQARVRIIKTKKKKNMCEYYLNLNGTEEKKKAVRYGTIFKMEKYAWVIKNGEKCDTYCAA